MRRVLAVLIIGLLLLATAGEWFVYTRYPDEFERSIRKARGAFSGLKDSLLDSGE